MFIKEAERYFPGVKVSLHIFLLIIVGYYLDKVQEIFYTILNSLSLSDPA